MTLRRAMLLLAYVGAIAFAATFAMSLFALDFICFDSCPAEADLATALSDRLVSWADTWVPGIVVFAIAWILCLILLIRSRRWGWLLAVVLAPPAGVALAVLVALWIADGHLFPTTWYVHGSWGAKTWLTIPPLLLGPFVTILAGHALRPRIAQPSIA